MQPRHHGADRDVENLGNLLVRETLHVSQQYRHPKVLGKRFDPQWEPIRRAMGYVRRLSERVNLTKTKPRDELASTKYCLADPGTEYLVYISQGAEASVDLSQAKEKLSAEWLDCTTGKSQPAESIDGGKRCRVKSPIASDAVLHLRRE